ncbi:MAG: PspC domain-containing protein [Bacteroidales bacterium]
MKKTVTANIGGMVFHIDEDAYEKLSQYLSHIREHFSTDQGRDEILSDIENRIAEMFGQKLTSSKTVITLDDVKEVISQLGEPEQMSDGEEEKDKSKSFENERSEKRLYRDPDDKYIAGVAGGLGAFLNLDPTWIRVAFVVFTFVYGFGPLLYIILWIVVPKARTTAERLEMRGEKVNLSNIEKTIREEFDEIKDNLKEFSEETRHRFKKKEKARNVRERNAQVAANLVKVFAKAAGVILILLAFSFMVAFISGIYLMPAGLHWGTGFTFFSLPDLLTAFLPSAQWVQLAMFAIVLIVGIPIFWMLLTGIQLLFSVRASSRYLGIFTFVVWLAALGALSISAVAGARNFAVQQQTVQEIQLEQGQWPELLLALNKSDHPSSHRINRHAGPHKFMVMWHESDNTALGVPEMRIQKSTDNDLYLEIVRQARGASLTQARENAESIDFGFHQNDSLIVFDPVFSYGKEHGFRNQKLDLILHVPEHKSVVLLNNMRRNMYVRWGRDLEVSER